MMKKLMQRILVPGAVFLGLLFSMSANAEKEVIEKSFSVAANGTLKIDSDEGSIEVETWNKNTVEVEVEKYARSQKRLDEFKVTVVQKGNDVEIIGDSNWNSRVDVEYVVKVPKQYNVALKTGGGSISVEDLEGNAKVNTSGGSIKIGNVSNGDVDAHTSGGSIKVGDVDGNLSVDTSGGSIRLGKITGTSNIDTSGGSITVEQGGSDLKAETSGGSIKIGPSKGDVDVDTSGGSIKVDVAEGSVKASTSGGSIRVEGSGGNIDVDTSGGSIYVGSSGGPVKAETAGGTIKIYKARGYIEAETAGGKIEAEMIETDNSKDTHVNLESAGGSITVYLPKTIEATVSANLRITRSARRDYRIYSDFPLTIKGENSDRVTADGGINGGGDRVNLSTVNGDIYIKMLDK